MSRWCLSPIIGNGGTAIDKADPANTGPYRALAADYGGHVALIPGNGDGTPMFNWCLCRLAEGAVSAAATDAALTVFPNLRLADQMTAGQRTWLAGKVAALGKPTGWIVAGLTVREALRVIGRYLDAKFDVTWMDVLG